jgi:hypothetical protein
MVLNHGTGVRIPVPVPDKSNPYNYFRRLVVGIKSLTSTGGIERDPFGVARNETIVGALCRRTFRTSIDDASTLPTRLLNLQITHQASNLFSKVGIRKSVPKVASRAARLRVRWVDQLAADDLDRCRPKRPRDAIGVM